MSGLPRSGLKVRRPLATRTGVSAAFGRNTKGRYRTARSNRQARPSIVHLLTPTFKIEGYARMGFQTPALC